MDTNKNGKLEYHEFEYFGELVGLTDNETNNLWTSIDADNSGDIRIDEMFEWFRMRLHQDRGRILRSGNATLSRSKITCDIGVDIIKNLNEKRKKQKWYLFGIK